MSAAGRRRGQGPLPDITEAIFRVDKYVEKVVAHNTRLDLEILRDEIRFGIHDNTVFTEVRRIVRGESNG